MDQPGVHGHAVQERLERRARRTQGGDHVHMAETLGVIDVHRADVRAHGHVFRLDHQNRCRRSLREACARAHQQVFHAPLQ